MSRAIEEIFICLVPHASVLGDIFELAGLGRLGGTHSSRDIARLVGLGVARLPEVIEALRAAERYQTIQQVAGEWRISLGAADGYQLGLLLKGAAMYRERVHTDVDRVRVVMSRPPQPSRFINALESTLEGSWGLLATGEILGEMAGRAEKRMTIMTPFVDADGAGRIAQLFDASGEGVERELIVRDGMPTALVEVAGLLGKLGVRVFDFRLPRSDRGEMETFHAKVIRIDDSECYVGSSNMTRWSFDYSLELGFHVTGLAATQVSRILDAVLKVSNPIGL
jgi:hypothetical protein